MTKNTTLSMTGFSTTTLTLPAKTGGNTHLSITLKSLNSRFFETTCKLPYPLAPLEIEIIRLCKERLFRGTILCSIHLSNPNALTATIEPSLATVQSYLDALATIQNQFSIEGKLSLRDIIILPNIFDTVESPLEEETNKKVLATITRLISELIEVRRTEGENLARDIFQRIALITTALKDLEERAEIVMQEKKNQVLNAYQQLSTTTGVARTPEATESQASLYAQLDKIDIHEEIVRFKNHIATLIKTLEAETNEKGKRIDFILQELFRETNTITAKCSDTQISTLAITIKVELEKTREQAQNIV